MLGFLASHNGTTMKGIISALNSGVLRGATKAVISNNSQSNAIQFAISQKIPAFHISAEKYGTSQKADAAIRDCLVSHDVNLVILSGYMKKISKKTLSAFPGRILNVHPSLLPNHAGLWGNNVHQAVLDSKELITWSHNPYYRQ